MNQLGVHLGGSSDALLSFGVEAAKRGVRTFQVHLSNPRTWDTPNGDMVAKFLKEIRPIVDASEDNKINLVVHGPFGVSLAKFNQYQYITRYFIECSKIIEDLGLSDGDTANLVTHVGSRVPGVSLADTVQQVNRLCSAWSYYTTDHRSVLCLENDAGSKKGTKIGSVKFLKAILNTLRNFPRVRMCWDTEHAFANGMSIDEPSIVDEVLKYAGVVHLNSIPTYVVKGGHLDRHSDVLIKDGQCSDSLLLIAKKCQMLDIPMILERSRDIVMEDRSYIIGRINNG